VVGAKPLRRDTLLPNGSAGDALSPQVLEAQQHGQHPLELSVEMNFIAAKPFQLVGVEGLTERLLPDQGAVGELLLAVL
jgi:hypothetical protein